LGAKLQRMFQALFTYAVKTNSTLQVGKRSSAGKRLRSSIIMSIDFRNVWKQNAITFTNAIYNALFNAGVLVGLLPSVWPPAIHVKMFLKMKSSAKRSD
jgi:hypothetical protein